MFLIVAPLVVLADDFKTLLCIPEATTGFQFDEETRKWKQASIDTSGIKYLVTASTDEDKEAANYLFLVAYNSAVEKGDVVVRQFGDEEISYWCDSIVTLSVSFHCEGMGTSSFVVDKTAGRYVRSSHGSYIDGVLSYGEDDGTLDSLLEDLQDDKEIANRVADKGGNSPVIEIGQCSEV